MLCIVYALGMNTAVLSNSESEDRGSSRHAMETDDASETGTGLNTRRKQEQRRESNRIDQLNLDDLRIEMKKSMQKRFDVVGGKLRLLLSDNESLHSLRIMVMRAAALVSESNVLHIEDVDIKGGAPSILYTICPTNRVEKTGMLSFYIDFASRTDKAYYIRI